MNNEATQHCVIYQNNKNINSELPESTIKFINDTWETGTATNTKIAYNKDLKYFKKWHELSFPAKPLFPVKVTTLLQFIGDHLGGMNPELEQKLTRSRVKTAKGPHAVSTIRRRLATLSVVHETIGGVNPTKDPAVKTLLNKAAKAMVSKGVKPSKKQAIIKNVLDTMLKTCDGSLIDTRDKALLLFAVASGGRRRSEIIGAKVEDLVPIDEGFIFHLDHSKTDQEAHGDYKPVLGRAAKAMKEWLKISKITEGPLFRGINRHGKILEGPLTGKSVARIVKKRIYLSSIVQGMNEDEAKEYSKEFSAHSLRSGFVTEWGRQGGPRAEGMVLTGHKNVAIFEGYYRAGNIINNQAARIFD